jgi:hypothetical protein
MESEELRPIVLQRPALDEEEMKALGLAASHGRSADSLSSSDLSRLHAEGE